MAGLLRVRDQHIAVFGGSGSGKTVLVSSFYGAAQERTFETTSSYRVVTELADQGRLLRQNYLGMKTDGKAPEPTRFTATPYQFTIKPSALADSKPSKVHPFDALRLVWHDYPGEWFEEEPSSEEEARRRVDAFRALLRSDVAIILVDGQKLLDHVGEEDAYLRSVFWGIRDGLSRLSQDLLDDDQPLERFPRIWLVALSKADLHPAMDVHAFEQLVIGKAGAELTKLEHVIRELVKLPDALSVGQDFLLLSSARFEPDKIDVDKRVGLDLILPVALMLPLRRLVGWMERTEIPRKWVDRLADNADALAVIIVSAKSFRSGLARIPRVGPLIATIAVPAVTAAVRLSGSELKKASQSARTKHDWLAAMLTQFQMDLDRGMQDDQLLSR